MKVILYCRKSTDSEDKQVMSLDAQENELRKIAERDGLEIVQVYRESMSAKAPGRPLFSEMLSKINQKEAQGILCWKLDRLARNPIDGGSISWMLQQGQILSIRTYDREYLPSDNVLLMSVEFGQSNQYIRDLSENVKRGNREKVRRGEWPNRAPFGYRNDRNTRTIVVVKSQAVKIQEIYNLYVTGEYSISKLGKLFGKSNSQIELILKRHVYHGMIEYKGELYPGTHKPIISKELFDKAQEVRNKYRVSPIRPHKLSFPYRGLMQCGSCGCKLTATRKKDQYDYYYCTNGKGICDQHRSYINPMKVEDFLEAALEKLHFDEELIEIMYEAARERLENGRHTGQQTLDAIQLQIHKIKQQEKKLLHTYTSGLIDKDLYTEEAQTLQTEKKSLESKYNNYLKNSDNGLATLELTKEVFLTSSRAISEFKEADSEQKGIIAKKLLWNFDVENKKALNYKFKSPFAVLANAPKSGDLHSLLPD